MDKIVIGIPTFKRPVGLRRLLNSIALMDVSDLEITILVADNEGDSGIGIETINSEYNNYPFIIETIGVKEQGISNVRNELINVGFGRLEADFLAMVDDDETVDINWIKELLYTQKRWNSDVVSATVLPFFEVAPPTWTNNLSLYWRKSFSDGPVMLVDCTTSILLSRTVYSQFEGCRFNPSYGLTGGGDKEFFTRLKTLGALFSFSSNAISHEYFGETRLTVDWAKQRSYRIGSADMRIIKDGNNTLINIVYLVKSILGLIFYTFKFIFSKNGDNRFLCILKIHRQFGKINGFSNKSLKSYYDRVHGN
jgi:succinoglycan biosynthesis protein ExoM